MPAGSRGCDFRSSGSCSTSTTFFFPGFVRGFAGKRSFSGFHGVLYREQSTSGSCSCLWTWQASPIMTPMRSKGCNKTPSMLRGLIIARSGQRWRHSCTCLNCTSLPWPVLKRQRACLSWHGPFSRAFCSAIPLAKSQPFPATYFLGSARPTQSRDLNHAPLLIKWHFSSPGDFAA